ncbi:MAG TPA: lipid-A-disaccharide synthase [Pseudolabrys sp.]|nr:lipid-A-disaccharide synthase [Pseudolabrys sp.]
MSPHIFLVAGEESGDRLGAALISAIRDRTQGKAHFSCVGGAHMAAEGVPSLFPLGDLAIVGFSSIPSMLLKILRRIREAADAVIAAKPDVLVIIDSPEFTHRVARGVRERAPRIPIVEYVCPSVWAWRPGRARAMRTYVDHVLALLPFEPKAMNDLGGPPCTFVGHPLTERLVDLRPNELEARLRRADPPLVLVLPGSRTGEIRRMAPVFGQAIARVVEQYGPLEAVVPAVPRLVDAVRAAIAAWPIPARVTADPDEKHEAFRTARAALTKSGTSTLELALAGVPMVAAYKVSPIEAIVGRLLIYAPSAILANLVLGKNVVPEFLQGDCTADRLAAALLPLLGDTPERRRQTEAFSQLNDRMEIGKTTPSAHAASLVLEAVGSRGGARQQAAILPQPHG